MSASRATIDRTEARTDAAPAAPGAASHAPGWLVWTALWIVYIVWGSTYLAIRITVRTLPPLLAAGARFVLAGLIVYAVLLARRGRSGVRISMAELGGATIVGTLLLLGGNGMVMLAERDVSSSLAALLIASVPLWVVLFRYLTGERVGRGTLAGVAVGFVGVGILVMPGGDSSGEALGMFLLILAASLWAAGSFLSKKLSLPADLFLSTAVQMLCGGVVLSVAGLARGEGTSVTVAHFSLDSLLALAYLVVAGSLLAFTSYVWLLQNAPISKVATYAYVNPVIAIFLGWIILAESITTTVIAGAAVIVASVAFIVRKESEASHPPETADSPGPAAAPGADGP